MLVATVPVTLPILIGVAKLPLESLSWAVKIFPGSTQSDSVKGTETIVPAQIVVETIDPVEMVGVHSNSGLPFTANTFALNDCIAYKTAKSINFFIIQVSFIQNIEIITTQSGV